MSRTLSGLVTGDTDLDINVTLVEVPADLITRGTIDVLRLPDNIPSSNIDFTALQASQLPDLDMSKITSGDLSSDRVDFTNNDIALTEINVGLLRAAELLGDGPGNPIGVGTDLEFSDTVECSITGCHAINASEITSATLIATDLTTQTLAGVSTAQDNDITLGSSLIANSGLNPNLELNSGYVLCGDVASATIHTDEIDTNGSDPLTLSCDIEATDDDRHINFTGGTLEVATLQCETLGSMVEDSGLIDIGIECDLRFGNEHRILQCPTIDRLHQVGYATTDFQELVVPASQFRSTVAGNPVLLNAFGSALFEKDVSANALTAGMNFTAGMVASFTIPENYYIASVFVDCESSAGGTQSPADLRARLTYNDIHNLPTINTSLTDLIVKQWDNSTEANVTTTPTERGVKMNTQSSTSSYDVPLDFVTSSPMSLLVEPTLAQHQAAHRVLQVGQHYNMFIGGAPDSATTYAEWSALSSTQVRGVVVSLRPVHSSGN
eukprot:COSAG01_NODE_2882_length_6914_cov_40.714894_6_plen_495_part_00